MQKNYIQCMITSNEMVCMHVSPRVQEILQHMKQIQVSGLRLILLSYTDKYIHFSNIAKVSSNRKGLDCSPVPLS